MRACLDANVLFSASNAKSNIARLVHRLIREHEVVASDLAFEEARRNIVVKRPAWHDTFIALTTRLNPVPSVFFPLPVDLSVKDQPLLCAAIRAECDYLVTGDRRDFAHLFDHTVEGVTVITLLRLAELLAGRE